MGFYGRRLRNPLTECVGNEDVLKEMRKQNLLLIRSSKRQVTFLENIMKKGSLQDLMFTCYNEFMSEDGNSE